MYGFEAKEAMAAAAANSSHRLVGHRHSEGCIGYSRAKSSEQREQTRR